METRIWMGSLPSLAQLVEHLTVVVIRIAFGNQNVAGSIPAARIFLCIVL